MYKYDYMSRLQEVWEILPDAAQMAAPGGGGEEGARYAEVQPGAFDDARKDVELEVPNLYQRLIHEHKDPVFRNRLRATVQGGVITMTPTPGGGGMPSFVPVTGELRLKAVFLYDAFNRRTVSIWVGITEWFHAYDGWREVAEYALLANHAVPIKHFVWGSRLDELIGYRYKDGGGQWHDYHVLHGGQDTSAKLVDEDGDVVEQYEYDPYGRVSVYVATSTTADGASSVGLPFLWKGLRMDAVTGLYYMRNRFYSASLGRFLSQDPIGAWSDSQNGGNGYAYAGNRPSVVGDPLGLIAGDPAVALARVARFVLLRGGQAVVLGPAAGALLLGIVALEVIDLATQPVDPFDGPPLPEPMLPKDRNPIPDPDNSPPPNVPPPLPGRVPVPPTVREPELPMLPEPGWPHGRRDPEPAWPAPVPVCEEEQKRQSCKLVRETPTMCIYRCEDGSLYAQETGPRGCVDVITVPL